MSQHLASWIAALSARELGDFTEQLVCKTLRGVLAPRNMPGYDLTAQPYGRIEVRSRVRGTDGEDARVTLTRAKVDTADHVVAVRWTPRGALYRAIMLPRAAVKPLYRAKEQARTDQAHISWNDWASARQSVDLTRRLLDFLTAPA